MTRNEMVLSQSRFALRCHAQSIRERERETRNTITTQNQKKKKKVSMHEICMNMWHDKRNCIMGSTQFKPSSTQISTNKNTSKCMKHYENDNGMKCMIIQHQINNNQLKTFTKISKFSKTPKKFQRKPKNLDLMCEMHEKRGFTIPYLKIEA